MNLLSVNSYNIDVCKQIVLDQYDSKIKLKFGPYAINNYHKFFRSNSTLSKRSTPRLSTVTSVIPCASFYYLNCITENNPEKIVDIGCGMNFFKDILH